MMVLKLNLGTKLYLQKIFGLLVIWNLDLMVHYM